MSHYRSILASVSLVLTCVTSAHAQGAIDNSAVRLTKLGGSVYMADIPNGEGGGNVAASVGPDGILLVDDMFAASVPKLQAALKGVTEQPIRVVINTHFHGDHIQGNRVLAGSAIVIGHDKCSSASASLPARHHIRW